MQSCVCQIRVITEGVINTNKNDIQFITLTNFDKQTHTLGYTIHETIKHLDSFTTEIVTIPHLYFRDGLRKNVLYINFDK